MRARGWGFGLLGLVVLGVTLRAGVAPQAKTSGPLKVKAEYNVMVPMRDGVRLSTDVIRPDAPGRFPVILVRNPYGNGSEAGALDEARFWAAQGYVYLHQDVRGRYDSEGTYEPYVAEMADGHDALEWAGTQAWSNGRIGMLGGSYLAAAQWLPAALRSPYLKAIVPVVSPFNYFRDAFYVGGAFSLASRATWGAGMAGRTAQALAHDWETHLRYLPLIDLDRALGLNLPHWREWIQHPTFNHYWQRLDLESRLGELDVPALSVGGWFDVFQAGTLRAFTGMSQHARTPEARRAQRLVMGPWPHAANQSTKTGEIEFGPRATIDLRGLQARWLGYWLKGDPATLAGEPPVRIFVMGRNEWRDEYEWPLARARATKYYLHSRGKAHTPAGDGTLDTTPPGREMPDGFVADPRNPVPTRGGNLLSGRAGPYDQRDIERRPDVLVYTSSALENDLEVTGPITMTVYAASSTRDTDFTAKLVDVWPDGRAFNLADGIIRARYRDSFTQPTLIEPGRVYAYMIDLWATSNVFRRGHRIRVQISSSNFPRFDRNPNTGQPFGVTAELATATQTVFHDVGRPSHIVLPVVPAAVAPPTSR